MKYIYIFGGLLVDQMMKKKNKQTLQAAGWAIAHFLSLSHDTSSCIVTQAHNKGHDMASSAPRDSHSTTTIRPRGPAIRLAYAQGESRARKGLAAGGKCRDTKNCIVAGATFGSQYSERQRYDMAVCMRNMALRHDAVCARHGA